MRELIKAQVLVGLAARLAFILGLNYEIPRLGPTNRELRRRLMWSIFTLDKMCSGGLAEMSQCRVENVHIQLPCNEQAFTLGIPAKTQSLRVGDPSPERSDNDMGTMAYLVRLVDIRDRILECVYLTQRPPCSWKCLDQNENRAHRYTRWLDVQKSLPPCMESQFATFEAELERFQRGLPGSLVMNPRNFRLRGHTSSRTGYIMLHVWLNQCYCDIYRPLVPHLRESLDENKRQQFSRSFTQHCEDQALQHALSILDIFAWARKVSNPLSIADGAAAYCPHQFYLHPHDHVEAEQQSGRGDCNAGLHPVVSVLVRAGGPGGELSIRDHNCTIFPPYHRSHSWWKPHADSCMSRNKISKT